MSQCSLEHFCPCILKQLCLVEGGGQYTVHMSDQWGSDYSNRSCVVLCVSLSHLNGWLLAEPTLNNVGSKEVLKKWSQLEDQSRSRREHTSRLEGGREGGRARALMKLSCPVRTNDV